MYSPARVTPGLIRPFRERPAAVSDRGLVWPRVLSSCLLSFGAKKSES